MILLKKILRKLYHFIAFLCFFFIVLLPVNAAVNITPPMDRYATIFLDGHIQYFNNSSWVNDNAFWSPGYVPQIATPSSPSEPSSYAWIASGTAYCGTSGGNITGFMGSANGSFFTYLQKIEFHSDGGNSLCSFTNANNEGTLIQFSCVSSNLSNFSIHYKYKNAPGVMVGQYPILGRSMSVTCNSSDSSSAINNQTQQIIQNDNSNTQQIIENNNSNTDKIDGTLKDSSVDSSDSTINNLKGKIPTNSVISDLLLLPVRFLQNFVNALGSSCSRFSLGSLYGTELFMPCINIESYLGSAIWTTIDLIISGLFVYSLRKKFIQIYQNLTNLKNGGNEVD